MYYLGIWRDPYYLITISGWFNYPWSNCTADTMSNYKNENRFKFFEWSSINNARPRGRGSNILYCLCIPKRAKNYPYISKMHAVSFARPLSSRFFPTQDFYKNASEPYEAPKLGYHIEIWFFSLKKKLSQYYHFKF